MSYNDLILEENVQQRILCVLKPARIVNAWTLYASGVYYNDFDYGNVINVSIDGVNKTEVLSIPVSNNTWYYDYDNERLYLKTDGTAPSGAVVVTYEIFTATYDSHWYRIPTDNTSKVVYFEPFITKAPFLKASMASSLFGYLPVESSSITLSNAEHFFEKHIYDSSFNLKDIDIYHALSSYTSQKFNLDVLNIKKTYSGKMFNVTYQKSNITITLNDRIDEFNKEFRNIGTSFFNTTDFTKLNPQYIGKPIRTVYGRCDKLIGINIDYLDDNPTTSDNRIYAMRIDGSNAHTISATVIASPGSTATRTYVDSIVGFSVEDCIYINKATDEYVHVTAIGSNYLEHEALVSGAAVSSDTVSRSTIGNCYINQGGTIYRALFTRDYTETVVNGVLCIQFNTSVESNLGINTFAGNEQIYGRVYGKQNDVTLGGSPFGSDSTTLGNLTNSGVILFDILTSNLGLAESSLDLTSFQSLATDNVEVGISIPETSNNNFPTYKDTISRFIQTLMLRIFLDNDNKWSVSRYAPLGSEDKEIINDEIKLNSVSYKFDYSDILSDIIVRYNITEVNSESDNVAVSSNIAKYLHSVEKQKTINSILLFSADALNLANRYSYVFGDRQGLLSLSSKNRFFINTLTDIIKVTREKLPGYEYVVGTDNSRVYNILEIAKSMDQVDMVLDDQKGADDNSGSW